MCSSTNSRIADERLPCWRAPSICVTNFDSVASWARAISFRSLQKASSRLTLVLWRPMMMERLTTKDFIRAPLPLCQNTPIRDESRKFDDDTMKRPVTMLSLRAQSVSAMADDSDYCKVAEHALSMLKVVYFREGADAA